jgi:molybdenum cofactor cytidylyltransferase
VIAAGEVVAVVLAAGLSRRFGPADKLVASYRGSPLVTHAARLILGFPFRATLAVTREDTDTAATLRALGIDLRFNPSPEQGIGSSLAIAARAAQALDAAACLILLGDVPNVTPAHIRRMLEAFGPPTDVVASSDGRHRSPPTLFGRRHFIELGQLSGDRGATRLANEGSVTLCEAMDLSDVDTTDDLAAR